MQRANAMSQFNDQSHSQYGPARLMAWVWNNYFTVDTVGNYEYSKIRGIQKPARGETTRLLFLMTRAEIRLGFLSPEVAKSTYVTRCGENHYVHNHELILRRHHAKT